MKYKLEIEIDLPRSKVIELFDNPDNLKLWQPGFISMEYISGTQGEVGAKYRLNYQMGKRKVEMIETITAKNLPDNFSGTYEAKNVWNHIQNNFYEVGPAKTKWVTENEFRVKGFMKLMVFFMPGAFKKQSFEYMRLFKEFAENAA